MVDKSTFNELFSKTRDLSNIGELEGIRGNDLGNCFIDITKRDIEEGNYNIDIIIYVRPDVHENKVMPAMQMTCIDVFGAQPIDGIELFYHPGQIDSNHAIGMEVAGMTGVFRSFGVTIKHPHSVFYNIEKLKEVFIKRAFKHLEKMV